MILLFLGLLSAAAVTYYPPRDFGELVAWVVGLAALVTATLYLMRQASRAFRFIEQIHDLTTRELEHTGNPDDDSMKDDLHGIAVSLGRLQRRVDRVESDLRAIYDPMHRYGPNRKPDRREDI